MTFNLLNLLIVAVMVIVPVIPTLWAIVDVPRRRFPSTKSKVIWFVAVTSLPCLGAILYLLLVRRNTQPLLRGNRSQCSILSEDTQSPGA